MFWIKGAKQGLFLRDIFSETSENHFSTLLFKYYSTLHRSLRTIADQHLRLSSNLKSLILFELFTIVENQRVIRKQHLKQLHKQNLSKEKISELPKKVLLSDMTATRDAF